MRDDDVFVTLGDYVNKGPNTKPVLNWLSEQTERGRCIALRGNHDFMMQQVLSGQLHFDHWLNFGGRETLQSYWSDADSDFENETSLALIPADHRDFLSSRLLPYYESDHEIFVHGCLQDDLDLAEQPEHELYWTKFEHLGPHKSGKKVICGHTAQKSGIPLNRSFATCIDTAVYAPDGWLTCLEIETGQYWQANQLGETRSNWLQPPEF